MDIRAVQILEPLKTACCQIFSHNLVGVYLHGSLAFGCFNWETGDLDFLVVTKGSPTLPQKETFVNVLLELDRHSPPKGFEMSLVLEKDCRHFVYPTPFELHFSNLHKAACRENPRTYCKRMHGTDGDLAAHFTVLRHCGIPLYGPPVKSVFGPVPEEAYWSSIESDIADAPAQIFQDPVYVVLNLCRVLAYAQSGAVLSKQQGAQWGLQNLPVSFHPLLSAAEKGYSGTAPFPLEQARPLLPVFAKEMLAKIRFARRAAALQSP